MKPVKYTVGSDEVDGTAGLFVGETGVKAEGAEVYRASEVDPLLEELRQQAKYESSTREAVQEYFGNRGPVSACHSHAAAVRQAAQYFTHQWVPVAECHSLKHGHYYCLFEDGHRHWLRMPTLNPLLQDVTHILSPWMGPMPEARESARDARKRHGFPEPSAERQRENLERNLDDLCPAVGTEVSES